MWIHLSLKPYFKALPVKYILYMPWELIYTFNVRYMPWACNQHINTLYSGYYTSVAMVFTISSWAFRQRVASIVPIYYFWPSFQAYSNKPTKLVFQLVHLWSNFQLSTSTRACFDHVVISKLCSNTAQQHVFHMHCMASAEINTLLHPHSCSIWYHTHEGVITYTSAVWVTCLVRKKKSAKCIVLILTSFTVD